MNTVVFEQHASAQIDDRISGKTFADNAELYSTLDHVTPSYVRDTGCWTSDVSNINSIAVAHEYVQNAAVVDSRQAGILVSPRHVIMAYHFHPVPSVWIRFVDNNNNVYEYDIIDKLRCSVDQDIIVMYLNEDVDSSLGFAKVMPSGSVSWLDNEADVPLFSYDVRLGQTGSPFLPRSTVVENKEFIGDTPRADSQYIEAPDETTHPQRYEFYDTRAVGDSGCPICLIVNGELVLLSTYYSSTDGPSILALYDLVNTTMATLSSRNGGADSYQLTDVDLSSFNITVGGKWTQASRSTDWTL